MAGYLATWLALSIPERKRVLRLSVAGTIVGTVVLAVLIETIVLVAAPMFLAFYFGLWCFTIRRPQEKA